MTGRKRENVEREVTHTYEMDEDREKNRGDVIRKMERQKKR